MGDPGRRGVGVQHLEGEADDDHADQADDGGLHVTEPASRLERQQREREHAGDHPGREQRHAEQEVEADRGAQELGQVGRHRDQLGLHPQCDRDRVGELVAADLGQVHARGDPELRAEGLDQHRHQVRRQDHPQQHVAILRTGSDVRGEVAGIDVGDGGDERRAEERPHRPDAPPFAGQRSLGCLRDPGLSGKRCADGVVNRQRPGRRRRQEAMTSIRAATDRPMLCVVPSISRVTGPSNGACSIITTGHSGTSPRSAR